MDLEELELGLVNVLAVTVARSHVGGGPAVVGAVPALFATAASSLVVPSEGHLLSGGRISGIGRWRGILVGDDVG